MIAKDRPSIERPQSIKAKQLMNMVQLEDKKYNDNLLTAQLTEMLKRSDREKS